MFFLILILITFLFDDFNFFFKLTEGQEDDPATIAYTMLQAFTNGQPVPEVVKIHDWNISLVKRIKKCILAMTRYHAQDRMKLQDVYKEMMEISEVRLSVQILLNMIL